MSRNNLRNVEEIVHDLCLHYGVDNPLQLSKSLGYKSNAVAKWLERGSIPVKEVSKRCPELNPKFLQGQDVDILNPAHKVEERLESKQGSEILNRILKVLNEDTSSEFDNHSAKILSAFRDQLKSQRSETDSMIQILNVLLHDE